MSLWFRRTEGMNADVLRKCADTASVSWDSHTVIYRKGGIGYEHGEPTDAAAIKDELEKILGYKPVEIDEPTIETETDQIQ
jgi:hypothetical protein